MKKTFYITTPIYYPNANLHLGHAYTTTLCDILARYHRVRGEETYFLTGSDENTQKVVQAAKAQGIETSIFLQGIIDAFQNLFKKLEISHDQFIRTSDTQVHWPGAVALWQALVASGDIYKKEYEGLYCVGHEAFVTQKDLVEGKCPDHGTEPEHIREENYFFRLSKYTQRIQEKIEADELRIMPETRKHEILALLSSGLEDVSFSRPRNADSVGIPVPGDESQVMYVWCDALSNYVTALGYGRDNVLFRTFWPANVHVVGKDILRFHAAIWPAMLLSAGLPLPHTILVHGMITSGGRKMSKTLGNIIDPQQLLAEYGADAVRYYLARHISPFSDGEITQDGFKESYNGNLANGLGNVVARIMQLAQTHLDQPVTLSEPVYPQEYTDALEAFEVHKAAEYVWGRIQSLDQRISETEPFKLVKTDKAAGKALIAQLVQELAAIDLLLEPFLPHTSTIIIEAILANKKPDTLFPRKD